ncbi:glutaredoxin 3 [Ochrobactrum sp. MR28]|nr:glutaredoxin 3 [Ochrobactrum sp. MR28]MBX8818908.1 glutaredoxin 3 [Ochrobactrum sp. MR31]
MKPEVLIYTTSWCPFCRRAKALFNQKKVPFTELDIEVEPANRRAMIEASGRTTVPQIFIDGTHVGGSDDLLALDAKGGLDNLLAGEAPAR